MYYTITIKAMAMTREAAIREAQNAFKWCKKNNWEEQTGFCGGPSCFEVAFYDPFERKNQLIQKKRELEENLKFVEQELNQLTAQGITETVQ